MKFFPGLEWNKKYIAVRTVQCLSRMQDAPVLGFRNLAFPFLALCSGAAAAALLAAAEALGRRWRLGRKRCAVF